MTFNSFVLAATTGDLDVASMASVREHADVIEFRMDLASDPSVALRSYDGDFPLIATNRAPEEGGEASEPDRLRALREAIAHPAVEAVDVELTTVMDDEGGTMDDGRRDRAVSLIDQAREHEVSVIVSVHDFEGTPPRAELEDTLSRAGGIGDVAKVAVTAMGPDDVLALLAATRSRTKAGERVATMAMGAAGRHSRAVAPLYGSRIGYAPVDTERATAPGQYDLATLSALIARLK